MVRTSPKCLVQPGDGVAPLVAAINGAKETIEIVIFRFNRREIERALAAAVARGVCVHALIASVNRGGERNLRELEMRLLAAGVIVARTGDDLLRYHDKLMIVDRRCLYLLAFNFTWLDMERSRSFGVITADRKMVREAARLFEADTRRIPFTPGSPSFLVSPLNARKQLSAFIKGARKQLLIYDPEIGDPAMIRLLAARAKAGVEIRIFGRIAKNSADLTARKLPIRLHTRTMVRDASHAFVGSQSLRTLELDARREVGIIVRDPAVVNRLMETFNADWEGNIAAPALAQADELPTPDGAAGKVAKKVARAVVRGMAPVTPVVKTTVREVAGIRPELGLKTPEVEATVKNAVKEAVKEVVKNFMEEAVQQLQSETKQ